MGLLEYLKKVLGDDEGQKIYEKIAEDKENVLLVDSKKESKYIEKSEFNNANESIKDYKKQLKDRDKQLDDLKGKVKDNEELTKEIDKLKDDNKKVTDDYEAKLTKLTFDTKFERALSVYKSKNSKALKALLDMEKVSLDGENFIGLEDQIKSLKESDPYLFEEEKKETDITSGTATNTDLPAGGTGTIITPGANGGGKAETIGAILAKQKAEQLKANTSNEFFK